jgi:pyruvyltransferase
MGFKSFITNGNKLAKVRKYISRQIYLIKYAPSIIVRVKYELIRILNYNQTILVTGWLPGYNRINISTNNWGDDVNVPLVESLTGKKVIPSHLLMFPRNRVNFLIIGSAIASLNEKSIVWGAGVLYPDQVLDCKPQKVHAVRGPITREYLLKHDIECPEVYGDPALLFPYLYTPLNKVKKWKIGFIPHHRDYDFPEFIQLKNKLSSENVVVIDVVNYGYWTELIDKICSCELIVSASLHGLILSDAYGVKSVWCEFLYKSRDYTKYYDYFLSVNRISHPQTPIHFQSISDFDELSNNVLTSPKIDVSKLIASCPFDIRFIQDQLAIQE